MAGDSSEGWQSFYQVLTGSSVITTPVEELMQTTGIGSVLYAKRPGDGSAREYAASCQKVLGGLAEYLYRVRNQALSQQLRKLGHPAVHLSDDDEINLEAGEYVYLPGIRKAVEDGATRNSRQPSSERTAAPARMELESQRM